MDITSHDRTKSWPEKQQYILYTATYVSYVQAI